MSVISKNIYGEFSEVFPGGKAQIFNPSPYTVNVKIGDKIVAPIAPNETATVDTPNPVYCATPWFGMGNVIVLDGPTIANGAGGGSGPGPSPNPNPIPTRDDLWSAFDPWDIRKVAADDAWAGGTYVVLLQRGTYTGTDDVTVLKDVPYLAEVETSDGQYISSPGSQVVIQWLPERDRMNSEGVYTRWIKFRLVEGHGATSLWMQFFGMLGVVLRGVVNPPVLFPQPTLGLRAIDAVGYRPLAFHTGNMYSLELLPDELDCSGCTSLSRTAYMNRCLKLPPTRYVNCDTLGGIPDAWYGCSSMLYAPDFDGAPPFTPAEGVNRAFSGCHNLKTIPAYNLSRLTTLGLMLNECYSLRTLPAMDLRSINVAQGELVRWASGLSELGGFRDLRYGFVLNECGSVTRESLIRIGNDLGIAAGTQAAHLGSANVPKLSMADRAIFTTKGWSITA